MRISGGEARGRPVRLPGGCRIRPTADRVKKSLFDILQPIAGKSFLDLFAGSGNVGLESLSRGARCAVWVERDIRLAEAIRKSVLQFGFDGRAEVVAADAERGLGRLAKRRQRFDIIFADPPYDEGWIAETLKWLERDRVLAVEGVVVLQHSPREMPEAVQTSTLAVTDQRRYGDTVLSFLEEKGSTSVPGGGENGHEKDRGISGIV